MNQMMFRTNPYRIVVDSYLIDLRYNL